MPIVVEAFDMAGPDDVSGLANTLARIGVARIERLAIFVKVEGDYDDGSRERSRAALEGLVANQHLADRTQLLTAVGCEGVSTPFGYVLADVGASGTHAAPGTSARLAMGFARSEPPPANELDSPALARRVADTVRAAAANARLSLEQVLMTFVKVPQPAASAEQRVRGRRTRGVAALGAGIALGEVDASRVTEASIGVDLSLHSRRVQNFAGPEVTRVEVIVLGNRPGAGGDLIACSTIAKDLIDSRSLRRMLLGAGLTLDADGELSEPERVAAFFIKAGPSADGRVRGARTTIFTSTIPPEKHMRAAQSGLLAALLGTTRVFNTGDPIQAAPEGGAVVCGLIRVGGD